MASIDEKVVRMTFDNAKFESAIQVTLKTLDKLKSALNMDKSVVDFNKLAQNLNNVDFSHMSNAIDQVANRFSSFGIVGMTVLQELTKSAMNAAKNIGNALTSQIISGGKKRALNIEQAKFQIQGLGYAWADVEEDINYGVKDTAYGLDSAAKAASQLLASNVAVGDSMKAALRGISGVAAMTSSEYDDIARVFTTVAGNGRLMGDQLNQLSARGLNVAATLGQALGKSESQIRDMVSKGKIDFATFSKAMDDAFGAHAKKANDTFTGALSNMKAALSRVGAAFATPAYENFRIAINALTPVIDQFKKSIAPLIDFAERGLKAFSAFAVEVLSGENIPSPAEDPFLILAGVLEKLISIIEFLPDAFMPARVALQELGEEIRKFLPSFNYDTVMSNVIQVEQYLYRAIDIFNTIFYTVIHNGIKVFETVVAILRTIPDSVAPIYDALKMVFKNIELFVKNFSLDDALTTIFETATTIIASFGRTIGSLIRTAYILVLPVIQAFQEAFSEVFGHSLADMIVDIVLEIENFITRIKVSNNLFQNLKTTFVGLFTLVGSVADILVDFVYLVGPKLATAVIVGFGAIIDISVKIYSMIGELIVGVKDFINELKTLKIVQHFLAMLVDWFNTISGALGITVKTVHEFIYALLDGTFEAFASVLSTIAGAFLFVAHAIDDAVVKVYHFVKELGELPAVQKVLQNTADSFDALRTKVSGVSSSLGQRLSPAFKNVQTFMSKTISKIRKHR